VTEDPVEAYSYAEGEEVGEVPNIPEGLWLENAGAMERRARIYWESVWKRAD